MHFFSLPRPLTCICFHQKLSVSNASHVTLRSVDFNLNGNISCEVTTESPNFYTATARNSLNVVGEYENDVIKWNIPAAAVPSYTKRIALDLREKNTKSGKSFSLGWLEQCCCWFTKPSSHFISSYSHLMLQGMNEIFASDFRE